MIGGLEAEREKVREKRDNVYIIFQALAKTGARNGEQESGWSWEQNPGPLTPPANTF